MAPVACKERAATVTPGRRTASIIETNSWVSGSMSDSARSCAISSQRASRSERLWWAFACRCMRDLSVERLGEPENPVKKVGTLQHLVSDEASRDPQADARH